MAKDLKMITDKGMVGIPFDNVVVDIKGNYEFVLFSGRKMYAMSL